MPIRTRRENEVRISGAETKGLGFALFVSIVLMGLVSPGDAQQGAQVARLGYLGFNVAGAPRYREAFEEGLRALGYVQGRNLVIEYRDAEGKAERLPALAAELVTLKVDVLVAGGGTLGAVAAQQATRTLPIVFTAVGDPVAEGVSAALRGRVATSRGCRPSSRTW